MDAVHLGLRPNSKMSAPKISLNFPDSVINDIPLEYVQRMLEEIKKVCEIRTAEREAIRKEMEAATKQKFGFNWGQ